VSHTRKWFLGVHRPRSAVPPLSSPARSNLLYSEIYNALKGHCTMVQKAQPDTLHFRFALVDTKEPNATINTVATYAPLCEHRLQRGVIRL
jgi:hypothetical protein